MKLRSPLRFALEGLEGAAILGGAVCTWPLSKRWLSNWGSDPGELDRSWDGDELVSPIARTTTRATTINAPSTAVWKRVAQFGLGKAGFYSYELLERIGGVPVKNVESIEDDWQTIEVGDVVLLHPDMGVRLSYKDDGRCLCFGKLTKNGENVQDISWSFYVDPIGDWSTRLILRSCFVAPDSHSLRSRVTGELEAALDAVMERRMLLTIKRLCEDS